MLLKLIPGAAVAALLCLPLTGKAQPATDSPPAETAPGAAAAGAEARPDTVIARVGGRALHMSDLQEIAREMPPELRSMPRNVLYPMLLDQLIDREALVLAARKEGLDKDPAVARQMESAANTALGNALVGRSLAPSINEAAIRARYEKDYAGKPGETEVHARHILVASEAEADKVIAELKAGGDFAALAKKYSTDPGGAQGGDLGFFKKGDMLPEFSAAAFALQPNQISDKPVHTQYGWHVIQVLEVKQDPAPTFAQMHDELRQKMIQEGVQKTIREALSGVKVEKFNLDGSPLRATDTAEPPAPPAK